MIRPGASATACNPTAWLQRTRGSTSVNALSHAQANGQARADVPTNFFLFFDSREFAHPGR